MTSPTIGNGYGLAKDVVCVDYDGTIVQWSDLDSEDPPLQPGVVEAMRAFAAAGKRIVIFTSRLSYQWLQYENRTEYEQYHHVRDVLNKNGIPFNDITGEKVPAEVYIDDMAVGFRGDWADVLTQLGYPKAHSLSMAERRPDGKCQCICGWTGTLRKFREHASE